ncbi:thioredoxin reductase [Candidatus Mancarchaeum acidiphilum]|uniref:Thioredoxin reductase n=1 Tax=Candidatus Mancarchaeum acidiphilum TaxID=1920749 RepID=A0A218NNC2_9ARCH|nr:thioredoxin-disulfide reductase [Candidatus Mancarchaeum acidiphilum]ASI13952.1 thioredoxin reductase [Candidatus Mancarchaeum acidiphilum]
MVEDVIVIGGGPAGLSASLYLAREDFHPMVIAGLEAGGQLLLTTTVENYPGFPEGIQGPELVDKFRKQSSRFGTRFVDENAVSIDLKSRPFTVKTASDEYKANCIIVATGASPRLLGLESEKKFIGKGVSTCATCDAPFFKNKKVIVVGGGDTAMEDSDFLTKFAESVTIVHRRDEFRASKIMQERVKSNKKINIIWNSEVVEILGDAKVTGARIKNVVNGEESTIETDGVFMAIGYSPNTKFLEGVLPMENGYIVTKDDVNTDIPGVYVAGDDADFKYRQAATAVGSGVKAALEARAYIQQLKYDESKGQEKA